MTIDVLRESVTSIYAFSLKFKGRKATWKTIEKRRESTEKKLAKEEKTKTHERKGKNNKKKRKGKGKCKAKRLV